MNFDQLKIKIEHATKLAFTELYQQHGHENIYAFALYSDEGAMTICPSTNSLAALKTVDPQDFQYYQFEPAEWRYEMQGADLAFNQISDEVRSTSLQYAEDDQKFIEFRQKLYQSCIDVLVKLKQENFFTQITQQEIFLFFTVSDYEFEAEQVHNIVTQLNDNHYCADYLAWMKTWAD